MTYLGVGVPSLISRSYKNKSSKERRKREQEREIKTRKKGGNVQNLFVELRRVMRFLRREFFFGESSSNISLNRDIIFVYITQR